MGGRRRGKSTFIRQLAEKVAQTRPVLIVETNREHKFFDLPMLNLKNKDEIAQIANGIYRANAFTYEGYREVVLRVESKYRAADPKLKQLPTDVYTYTLDNLRNWVIFFDDCKNYTDDKISDWCRDLCRNASQTMNDLFFTGHGISDIPSGLFRFSTKFIMFATEDNPMSRRGVSGFEELLKLRNQVNEKARTNHYHYQVYSKS
ncbi:hypothetical protein C7N43_38145 [Sphingobacteriales bacterium UPWRP_1]|nr:hypothetical protein B6N25_06680 [Sphingobacteriales bacterium TSM_CSS]PSJ71674.1 hypothetical protein C7N43_38145 [Sphingobacteriales bacterium UPWRP_1]